MLDEKTKEASVKVAWSPKETMGKEGLRHSIHRGRVLVSPNRLILQLVHQSIRS